MKTANNENQSRFEEIGTLNAFAWIGEGIALSDLCLMPFSIVTQSNCKILKISRTDIIDKFPKEFIESAAWLQQEKQLWLEKRLSQIKN